MSVEKDAFSALRDGASSKRLLGSVGLRRCAHAFLVTSFSSFSFSPADELVSPRDLDPAQRYIPPQEQRNVSMRFSNQVEASVSSCNSSEGRWSFLRKKFRSDWGFSCSV